MTSSALPQLHPQQPPDTERQNETIEPPPGEPLCPTDPRGFDPTYGSQIGSDPVDDPTQGTTIGSQPYDDPAQGRRVGADPYDDPTQGRKLGADPYDDPTQGRTLGADPYDDPTRARLRRTLTGGAAATEPALRSIEDIRTAIELTQSD